MISPENKTTLTKFIKQQAIELGFDFCGIAKAGHLDDDAKRLDKWLDKDYHGKMQYMENHFEKRTDPRKLVAEAKSVISLLFNYYNPEKVNHNDAPKIAMYAYGKDYHKVVKKRLRVLLQHIEKETGKRRARYFVDSAPVLERAWAAKAGLGWIGKNSLLINKQKGSYFFLAEIICDLELDYDKPIKDYCGSCTRCIDACPTDAIVKDKIVDASKCISYLTIELKDENIPETFSGKMNNWAFGCDICQQVCPWNSFSEPHQTSAFNLKDEVAKLTKTAWENMDEPAFERLFAGTPLKRAKYSGIKRNVIFLQQHEKHRK